MWISPGFWVEQNAMLVQIQIKKNGGADETRTRDLLRDRQAF